MSNLDFWNDPHRWLGIEPKDNFFWMNNNKPVPIECDHNHQIDITTLDSPDRLIRCTKCPDIKKEPL